MRWQRITADAILDKASEIQGRGIYGDEIMIAGAAEFAAYFEDADAILSMMDTLTNYAAGMSGGGALDSTAMVDYATNLGKIMSGSYDAMTKKGFAFTEAQQAIMEGTATEQQIVEALGAEYLDCPHRLGGVAALVTYNAVQGIGWLTALCAWIAKTTGAAQTAFGVITGGINVVIQFFVNLGLVAANIALGIWNAIQALCSNMGAAFHNTIGWASDAFSAGAAWGDSTAGKISSLFDGLRYKPGTIEDYASQAMAGLGDGAEGFTLDDMAGNVGDIADGVAGIADTLSASQDELKYLREIAEREAINRFTTAEIKIEMNNQNTISSSTDLDGILSQLESRLEEAVLEVSEGVHT